MIYNSPQNNYDESNEILNSVKRMKTLLCAAVHTVSLQHKLESCAVYGRSGNTYVEK